MKTINLIGGADGIVKIFELNAYWSHLIIQSLINSNIRVHLLTLNFSDLTDHIIFYNS